MLAYVFWHIPDPATPIGEYTERLHAFHGRLRESPPAGLLTVCSWKVKNLPWLGGQTAFEDWYVLDDTAHLDALAVGAVSPPLRSEHDAVAGLAASGTAGLYKPARGAEAPVAGTVATWFSKPAGESYDELYAALDRQDRSITSRLWQRFLTLGPAPEFCIVGDEAVDLAARHDPLVVQRRR